MGDRNPRKQNILSFLFRALLLPMVSIIYIFFMIKTDK